MENLRKKKKMIATKLLVKIHKTLFTSDAFAVIDLHTISEDKIMQSIQHLMFIYGSLYVKEAELDKNPKFDN
jgi:hypothetical protein